jgi:hypothetical protein
MLVMLVDVVLVDKGVTGVVMLVDVVLVDVGATGVLVLVGDGATGGWGKLMKLVKAKPESATEGKLLLKLVKKSPAGLNGAGTGVLVVLDVELVGEGETGIGVGVGGLKGMINCERFCNRREPLRPAVLSFLLPKLNRIVATKAAATRVLIHADTFVILGTVLRKGFCVRRIIREDVVLPTGIFHESHTIHCASPHTYFHSLRILLIVYDNLNRRARVPFGIFD